MKDQNLQPPLNNNSTEMIMLCRWTYSSSEWQEFMKWKTKDRWWHRLIEISTFSLLTAGYFVFFRNLGWMDNLLIGLSAGFLYSSVNWIIENVYNSSYQFLRTVIITNEAVIINGEPKQLTGLQSCLKRLSIIENSDKNILEFTCGCKNKIGGRASTFYVLIPKGKLIEAVKVIEQLNRQFLIT